MNTVTRRKFIQTGLTAGAAVTLAPYLNGFATTPGILPAPLGFQSWTIRETLTKDFAGTLKRMAGYGYKSIEMCSPQGYAKYGFGPLEHLKAKEMKQIINDAGMTCVSCHYIFHEFKTHAQERIDFAKELGLTQMVVSAFGLPNTATLSDWKKAAQEMNGMADLFRKNGLQLVYHNHNWEVEKLEGELIYDVLLRELDPNLIKMQFQVWVIIAGYKAADYFRKYPGRFISAHLSDWPGTGEAQVPIGQGKVDWKEFFEAAKVGGLKNFYVEMDAPTFEPSAKYLLGLDKG
jgi:sugar phosphate isomerase/epimerase